MADSFCWATRTVKVDNCDFIRPASSGLSTDPSEAIALSTAGRHFLYRGDLKLLKELESDWEIYDLSTDPYERHDLAGIRPELLQKLLADFQVQAAKSNFLDR
ncbi:MAG: hypothetical protein P8M18_01760 [Woeseiaceae bacterium]|nr:hypothetical protein [Woeseiaceae bacterium]